MAVKICKHCGEANKETAYICIVCSSSLQDVDPVGTLDADKKYEGVLLGSKNKVTTCSHCHETVEPDAQKCKYCGAWITRSKPAVTYHEPEYTQSRSDGCAVALIFVATFFIPLVGLIVGGIFAFSEDEDKKSLGKALLIFGLIMIALGILVGLVWG